MTPSIALVILAKNQREDVKEIIAQVGKFFTAVYILDDNSTDGTQKIEGAKVFTHPLADSFATHRNWILSKVKEDWTFFLDADERVSLELIDEIHHALHQEGIVAYAVPRLDIFAGTTLHHGEVKNISLVRLAQTQLGQGKWRRAVHEYWSFPADTIAQFSTPLLHYAHKDVTSFMAKLHRYAMLEKNERNGRGKSFILWEIFTYPLAKFIQNYFLRRGFLDGYAGLVYAFLMSYYSLIKRIFWYEDLVS